MPQFQVKQKDSKEVAKATFHKKEDYRVVTLNNDPMKRERVLHVMQADRLIANKKATEVKTAKLDEREIEQVITPVKAE